MDAQLPYAALTAEEQLERVHHVVAMLDQRVAMLQQLLDALTRHAHAPDGTLMTPLKLAMGAIHGRALGDNPQAWF
ncbi:MAG TPA: hypothetical protein VNK91_01870 [Burkholderiaceae bacterium]|nr:hypothetical protein [Burkholderiaceae bacterium]